MTDAFRKNHGELNFVAFEKIVRRNSSFIYDANTIFMVLQASGYPIEELAWGYRLKSYFQPYQEGTYTIVDIETNGSKPVRSQIIEIGAIKIKNGEIIDEMESFVECAYLPYQISLLTGIEPHDLVGAPSRQEVLRRFKEFLGDSVFVAHNASFDYTFLSASFNRFGLGSIGNQTICTIDLAKRSFESPKYGLAFLNEFLDLNMDSHHRAYSDAVATSKIFLKSLETLPDSVKTVDDLVKFSTSSKSQRRKAKNRAEEKRS